MKSFGYPLLLLLAVVVEVFRAPGNKAGIAPVDHRGRWAETLEMGMQTGQDGVDADAEPIVAAVVVVSAAAAGSPKGNGQSPCCMKTTSVRGYLLVVLRKAKAAPSSIVRRYSSRRTCQSQLRSRSGG